jgi:hypothetical protein
MRQVPVERIVGSEGRYRDFNKRYLPRYEYLRQRWMNIDLAHLKNVNLPPISLYEIGGLYFVRDGNHRVSVARMKGVVYIDAEVVSLNSEIRLDPDITRDTLTKRVIAWEQRRFFKKTGFDKLFPPEELIFSAAGRYDEIYGHILVHKFYINQNVKGEISFRDGMISWYNNVFKPIYRTIDDNRVMLRFPGRTPADLYVWTSRHWDALKQKYGDDYTMDDAVRDYSMIYGKGLRAQIQDFLFNLFTWLSGKEKV